MRACISDVKRIVLIAFLLPACELGGGEGSNGIEVDNPGSRPIAPSRCGNGAVEAAEDCDEAELNGETCESLGFVGGTLGCDVLTCRYNVGGCVDAEILRNDDTMCETSVSCGQGDSGNPQNMVECFTSATVMPPFRLTRIGYELGNNAGVPDSLNLELYEWSGSGPPGALITTLPLGPESFAIQAHTIALETPLELAASSFCVGLGATDPNDGFSLRFSDTSTRAGASWLQAPRCGVAELTDTASVIGRAMGNWCISATIGKAPPQQ